MSKYLFLVSAITILVSGCGNFDITHLNPESFIKEACQCRTLDQGYFLVDVAYVEDIDGRMYKMCPKTRHIPYKGCKVIRVFQSTKTLTQSEFIERVG